MSIKILRLRNRILDSLKLLASPGNIQLSYFPEFVCKGDELAASLNDWLELYLQNNLYHSKFAFTPEELKKIIDLDNEISSLLADDFSDEAVLTSNKWQNIRKKAMDILKVLNEPYSPPNSDSI